jgi:hypothetical protein
MNVCSKLERFSMASLSSLVECLFVKQEPTPLKNLSGAPLEGRLLALPTNNRLGWIGLPWTNTLAYYEILKIMEKKFYNIGPRVGVADNEKQCSLLR